MSGFELHTITRAASSTMVLSGEADLAVADEIVREGTQLLADEATRLLVIDLGEVTFLDSTTLGALVQLRNSAIAANKQLQLTRLPARVVRLFDIAGLTAIFDVATEEH